MKVRVRVRVREDAEAEAEAEAGTMVYEGILTTWWQRVGSREEVFACAARSCSSWTGWPALREKGWVVGEDG